MIVLNSVHADQSFVLRYLTPFILIGSITYLVVSEELIVVLIAEVYRYTRVLIVLHVLAVAIDFSYIMGLIVKIDCVLLLTVRIARFENW